VARVLIGWFGCVEAEADVYFTQLGLDDISLRNHAALTLTDYHQLKAIVNRTCGPAFLSIQGMKAIAQLAPEGRSHRRSFPVDLGGVSPPNP